ncbi:peptidase c14 [Nannochloropsis oceanica]
MDALKAAFGKEIQKQANKVLGDVMNKVSGSDIKIPGALKEEERPSVVPFQSDCSGRKKAVFVGINYFKSKAELFGCINDVKNVKSFIIQNYGFVQENIKTFTDEPGSGNEMPTRANIINALKWLASGATSGDSLFFHYSGHGGTARDLDGDEVDNFDETILPSDFEEAGQILDDEIHAILVAALPVGVRLTAIFDSCHSGSALDLPWHGMDAVKHLLSAGGNEEARKKAEKERTNTDADVIQFSGCRDDQTSADARIDGQPTGAASFALLSCLRANPNQNYTELLQNMRKTLAGKYTQVPQLSTAHPIDLNVAFNL